MRKNFKKEKSEMEKTVHEACAVSRNCDGICRQEHKMDCPAFYRFVFERRRHAGRKKLKKEWIRKYL